MSAPVLHQSCGRSERGFAIVLASGIIAMLMASAVILISQASSNMQVAGGLQTTGRARFIAEAAGVWGASRLEALAYPEGSSGGMSLSSVQGLPRVQDGDLLCAGAVVPCGAYHLLTQDGPVNYGGGTYAVAVTCNPGACNNSPSEVVNFELRALGTMPGGVHKILEVTLQPH